VNARRYPRDIICGDVVQFDTRDEPTTGVVIDVQFPNSRTAALVLVTPTEVLELRVARNAKVDVL